MQKYAEMWQKARQTEVTMLILYSHTNAFFNNSQYDLFVNFMIIIFICCTHFTPICNITLYTSLLFIERIHVLNVTTEMVSISFATFRTLKSSKNFSKKIKNMLPMKAKNNTWYFYSRSRLDMQVTTHRHTINHIQIKSLFSFKCRVKP